MMKVGIIRCQQTEDMCPGNTDFKVAKEGKMAFENTGPVEVIGFALVRMPGKKLQERNSWLISRGNYTCFLYQQGNPGYPCLISDIKNALERNLAQR